MRAYTQTNRPMAIITPGGDTLLLVSLKGHEAISQPFQFYLDVVVDNERPIRLDQLVGREITVRLDLPTGACRYFSGCCNCATEGERDEFFTPYQLEIVPQFWMYTKRFRSRIFQYKTVPDILKEVLKGLRVNYQGIRGTFYPRDFCVQYRESDYNFACRLLEEEGIYYFFTHSESGHEMVLGNTPEGHPNVPGPTTVPYHPNAPRWFLDQDRVHHWKKTQLVTPSRYTLWDSCFELPGNHLEATRSIQESVPAGKVNHQLALSASKSLEVHDWPGEYAQRFDGVGRGGEDQPANLQHVFKDNQRTVAIRMQQEALPALLIQGVGHCRHFIAGHQFTLAALEHAGAKDHEVDGDYVLTSVTHSANQGGYRSGDAGAFVYYNNFTCIPTALPFRPPRLTTRPIIPGTQTAVVVGPAGGEIFTDKYGRVKVQFPWDPQGKSDLDSSGWLRVATPIAGKQWGFLRIPRVGEEVIVDFLEGDPDKPIIIGSVYNADMMPPYKLPESMTQTGLKTRSAPGGGTSHFNELRFEDKKGSEYIYFHAEKDFRREVENNDKVSVSGDRRVEVQGKEETESLKAIEFKAGNTSIRMDAQGQSIELRAGESTVQMNPGGIRLQGLTIDVASEVQTQVQGLVTQVAGDALLKMNGTPIANGKPGAAANPIQNLVQQVVNEAVGKLAAAAVGGHGAPDLLHQVMQNAVGKLAGAILPGGKPGSPADAFQGLMNQVVQEAVSKLTAAVHPGGPGGPGKSPPPHGAPTPVAKSAKETRRSS